MKRVEYGFYFILKRGTKWQVIFVAIVAKRLQAQVVVLVLTARTNHTNLSVLMGARILLARIVAKRLQVQVAVLALAVRIKRINLSNIRQIYAILTTKPYLVGLDIFEKDKNDNHTAI